MITLNDGVATLTLPNDLQWLNEFAWSPVEQGQEYSLSGALIVQEGVKLRGREITLFGGEDSAWITRAVLLQLYAFASAPGKVMTLTLHARTFTVMFRHPGAIEAAEIIRQADPADSDFYSVTINLFEVTP